MIDGHLMRISSDILLIEVVRLVNWVIGRGDAVERIGEVSKPERAVVGSV